MLTIFRRHLKSCSHRSEGWAYRRCHCPIWADGRVGATDIRCSLDTRDWERGQEIVRDWEADGRGPMPAPAVQEEIMTVARACEQIVADARARSLRPDTIAKYKLLSRELEAFAAGRKIKTFADFDLAALTAFRASWKNANLAALKKLERLRSFFRFARDNGWVSENLVEKIKSPRVTMRPTLPFSHDEMTRIFKAAADRVDAVQAQGKDNARRLRGLILLLRYSGLRIGDALSCSIDRLADGKLRLYTQKTRTHVHCPLPEFVVKELERMPQRSERYWFWSGVGDVHSLVTKWEELLRTIFDDAKTPDGHAHRFRDTFAVDLLLAGVPLERVAILLGHSSVRITEKHYSPWVRERQEQAEADVRRTWARDPLVLLESVSENSGDTKVTQ
ncbi:MAG: tyrosine-type recombinase/integrase [Candidatus Acidiferrales bacterium]